MNGEETDGGDSVSEAELRAIVRDELESQDTLGESGDGLDEETVREIAREEGKTKWTRGGVLAAMGGAAGAATAGTAGASTGSTAGSLDVGSVTSNTYRVSGNWYGGPASARSELTSELGSSDAGAKYEAEDTGAWYHWDGSSWTLLPGEFSEATADEVTNKNYVEEQVTASEGSAYTADLTAGNVHKLTLTGDVSIDISNVDSAGVNSIMLHLVQDGTGGRTPSFTPTVVWSGGSAPSWSTAANAEDVVTLVHDPDGSQWLGFEGGTGFA